MARPSALSARRHLAALGQVLLLASACTAFPTYWASDSDCFSHPAQSRGNHMAPQADRSVIFTFSSGDNVISSYCPGVEHTVQIRFSTPRFAYVTTSMGTLSSTYNERDNKCTNRHILDKWSTSEIGNPQETYALLLRLDCSAAGPLELKVTSAEGSSSAYQQATLTVLPDPSCRAVACAAGGDGNLADGLTLDSTPVDASALQQPGSTLLPSAATPEAALADRGALGPSVGGPTAGGQDATGASSGQPKGGQGIDCADSDLGYACAVDVGQGTVHWSIGTSLPNNPCTQAAVSTAGKTVFQVNADIQGLQMAHFAFQAQATGWIALALTARPGKMYPADAVLGYVNPDAQGSVQSFYLRNNFPTFNDAFGGWASYMGVVQASGRTWVCFSRRLVEPTAPGVKNITTDGNENGAGTDLSLNWAIGPDAPVMGNLTVHRAAGGIKIQPEGATTTTTGDSRTSDNGAMSSNQAGSGTITSTVATSSSSEVDQYRRWVQLHAACMVVAWLLLVPIGLSMASQRWACSDGEYKGCAPWLWLHFLFTAGGLGTFGYGYYIAVVKLNNPSAFSSVGNVHPKLGLAILVVASLQLLLGVLRPSLSSVHRAKWLTAHSTIGRLLVGAAWANCILGILLFHAKFGESLVAWLVPAVLAMVGILIVNGLMGACKEQHAHRKLTAQHKLDSIPETMPRVPAIRTKSGRVVPLLSSSGVAIALPRSPSKERLLGEETPPGGYRLQSDSNTTNRMRDRQHRQARAGSASGGYQGSNPYQDHQNPLYEFAPQRQYMSAAGTGPAGFGSRDQHVNPVYSNGNSPPGYGGPAAPPPVYHAAGTYPGAYGYQQPPSAYQQIAGRSSSSGGARPGRAQPSGHYNVDLSAVLESQRRTRSSRH